MTTREQAHRVSFVFLPPEGEPQRLSASWDDYPATLARLLGTAALWSDSVSPALLDGYVYQYIGGVGDARVVELVCEADGQTKSMTERDQDFVIGA